MNTIQNSHQLKITLYWIRRFEKEKRNFEAVDTSLFDEDTVLLHKACTDGIQSIIDDLKEQMKYYKKQILSQIIGGLHEKRILSDIR